MPEAPLIPEDAMRAALAHARSQPLLWQYVSEDDIRGLLEAAAPVLAAKERAAAVAEIHTIVYEVRRGTAERIAATIEANVDPLGLGAGPVETEAWRGGLRAAAGIARQIGEDHG